MLQLLSPATPQELGGVLWWGALTSLRLNRSFLQSHRVVTTYGQSYTFCFSALSHYKFSFLSLNPENDIFYVQI